MTRITRADVFDPEEVAIVHVISRAVRTCWLFGEDPISGKDYSYRKEWIEGELVRQAAQFGIDLLGFSCMSTHFHLILRSRPDVVAEWDDTEVARRWLMLCPIRKTPDGKAEEPNEPELNGIRNDPDKLKTIRRRLSDISWWMRLMCQRIAQRANNEDGNDGKFFNGRFRAVRLLDEEAVLACAAYVDLNPIRAKMVQTLEASDFTSIQRRIESLLAAIGDNTSVETATDDETNAADSEVNASHRDTTPEPTRPGGFLSPLEIDELRDPTGPCVSSSGMRASDKGFLPIPQAAYIELLDWTARQVVAGKRGATPESTPAVFERLKIRPEAWYELVTGFGKMFSVIAGQPHRIDEHRSRSGRRFRTRRQARELAAW